MKILNRIIVIAVITLFLSCKSKCDKNSFKKEELLTTLNQFNLAFQNGDVKTLEAMITDNYIHTNGTSKAIHKKEWLNYLKKREHDIISGKLEVVDYNMDEIAIEFHCNSAIVTAKVKVITKTDKELKESAFRVTNLWVNNSGTWQRAAFHDGKID
ncbi:nuclear transport factor 2 family protein [uncultured Croceitalea sp.]|uniref:nuclear transport factor 2 family protein n=1 Tax=uncultured Croceitalea sp. TaxID=1798908 RepID=UPI003305FB94